MPPAISRGLGGRAFDSRCVLGARKVELGGAGFERSRQNTSKAPLRYQILSNASGRPRRPSKGNRPTLQKAKKKEENGQNLQNSGTCGNLGPSKTLPPENIGLLPNSATQEQNQRHRGKRGCSRSTSHRKNYLKESRTPSKYQKEHDRIQHRRHRHQCLCPQPLRYHMRFPYPRVA